MSSEKNLQIRFCLDDIIYVEKSLQIDYNSNIEISVENLNLMKGCIWNRFDGYSNRKLQIFVKKEDLWILIFEDFINFCYKIFEMEKYVQFLPFPVYSFYLDKLDHKKEIDKRCNKPILNKIQSKEQIKKIIKGKIFPFDKSSIYLSNKYCNIRIDLTTYQTIEPIIIISSFGITFIEI